MATCSNLLTRYKVFGRLAAGMDVGKYTNGQLKWFGCMGDGCTANSFYCRDIRGGIEFGTTGTELRALLGSTIAKSYSGCCARGNTHSLCNMLDTQKSLDVLCAQLGYGMAKLVEIVRSNTCPEVHYDIKNKKWTSDWKSSIGYGKRFSCKQA
jgi:hypothetical protein